VIGLSVRKVCEIARHSLDNILVFGFLTLSSIAIFNNYLFISDSVSSFLYLITSSLIAGIGNRIQTSSADENLKEMRMINCAYMAISSWASAFLVCLYQPFMILWLGEEYILDISSVILIVALFYIQKSGGIQSVYTEANGLYWENRNRYLYEALLHLLLGLVLTMFFGINGVLAAAVISLFVFGGIFSPLILFRNYYHTSARIYFLDLLKQSVATMICCLAVYFLGGLYHGSLWMTLLVRFTVCLLCFPVLYMLLYSRDELFRVTVKWCIGLIKN
jgi:O-antigen/teichoic acid export membrane protein